MVLYFLMGFCCLPVSLCLAKVCCRVEITELRITEPKVIVHKYKELGDLNQVVVQEERYVHEYQVESVQVGGSESYGNEKTVH